MGGSDHRNPLAGISSEEHEIMQRLLRMKPEPQRAKAKPETIKGAAQRLRRERERLEANAASDAD
jgi:hypothetical protein